MFVSTHHSTLRVSVTREWINVGCTRVSLDAAKRLVELWEQHYGAVKEKVEIQ